MLKTRVNNDNITSTTFTLLVLFSLWAPPGPCCSRHEDDLQVPMRFDYAVRRCAQCPQRWGRRGATRTCSRRQFT